MPTYEYRCPDGHDFERFLKMSEATDTLVCPVHGKTATRIISGGAGLVFKGSGFYITDYGKDGKKDQQKPASAAAGSDGKSSDGKSSDGKSSDGKSADGKADGKSGDSKASDGKSTEGSKTSDTKAPESKPAKPAATTGSGKSGSGTTE
jgi:putative FmdB family regulatory protein